MVEDNMKKEMKKEIKKVMAEAFEVDENTITENATMESVENWDSLGHLKLLRSVEEQFNVTLNENDMLHMTSFVSIERILHEKKLQKREIKEENG